MGASLLKTISVVECGLTAWVMAGKAPGVCAIAQTALLVVMNVNGLMWARRIIRASAGMIIRNIAFLALVWICRAIPAGRP